MNENAFIYGVSEDIGAFIGFMGSLSNPDGYGCFELNFNFDDSTEDRQAFLNNFGYAFKNIDIANDIYTDFIPVYKQITDFETNNPMLYEARLAVFETLHKYGIDFLTVKMEIE